MTHEDEIDLMHEEEHVETEHRVHVVLTEAFPDPACRAHVLATLLAHEVQQIDDVEALQDVFSMLGMIVYQRAVRDYALMHPAGNA